KDLDYEFVCDFAFWLKTVRNCGYNSTMKYICNMKKIVTRCVKRGLLPRDPFIGFKTTKKEVDKSALSQDELEKTTAKEFSMERRTLVRDIFVFSCYTGLAYIDVSKLRRSQIVKGVDGEQWIMTHRQKTDSPTRLPLLPMAL